MARRSRYVAYMHQMRTAGKRPAVSVSKNDSVRAKLKQMKEKAKTMYKKEGN